MCASTAGLNYKAPEAIGSPSMTTEEVAHYFCCSEKHVRDMANAGKLPGVKIGRLWRFNRARIYALLDGEA